MPLSKHLTVEPHSDQKHDTTVNERQCSGVQVISYPSAQARVRVAVRLALPDRPRNPLPDRLIFIWAWADAPLPEVIRDGEYSYIRNTSVHHDKAVPVYDLATTHYHEVPV